MTHLHNGVESNCYWCDSTRPKLWLIGKAYRMAHDGNSQLLCRNYDRECRHRGEALGFYIFAWRPRFCRNRRLRWLCWVEKHDDGTYTLGDRAF